ncbi:hypothetical protein [Adhaeretor mobilis]|uniref:Uncharacterized protein n=1 Tax=Adhaeretor mobilis TaxID=1930276 RepID=A0A517MY46_9BACT|nr:hypothetical protein [Adhaeretor mobilis]QDS99776.1 hypothetical protein HG15A2_31070 [Adhaeretor mobilis]
MLTSVLDAIREGKWNYEPASTPEEHFDSTKAMPGSDEKLEVMAARVKAGLPLWHGADRIDYDDTNQDDTEP